MSIAQNQLRAGYIILATVSATEPPIYVGDVPQYELGDSYYNSTTHLVHTVIQDSDDSPLYWGEGEVPVADHIYYAKATNVFYGVNNGVLYANIGTGELTNPMVTDLDMGTHKITNLVNGTNSGDAVNKSQLDTKANITDVILQSEKGVANGIPTLDANGIIPASQVPSYSYASTTNAGIVKIDGTTITTNSNGVISATPQVSEYNPPILSYMWSDHILNDIKWLRADTFSWQSGVAYRTVWDTLSAEYDGGVNKKDNLSENFTKTGNVVITDGVANNFSNANYLRSATKINISNPWQILIKITTPSSLSLSNRWNNIIAIAPYGLCFAIDGNANGFRLFLGNNGTSWNIAGITGSHIISPNTVYYIKIEYDGFEYHLKYSYDNTNFVTDITVTSDQTILTNNYLNIGKYAPDDNDGYFEGSVDLNSLLINSAGDGYTRDEIVWEPYDYISYRLTPSKYKIAEKSEEQKILNLYNYTGRSWYYILDLDGIDRFKLPRNTDNSHGELISTQTTSDGGWCRVYADGWCEQGGFKAIPGSGPASITFLKAMSNTNYSVLGGVVSSSSTAGDSRFFCTNRTTTGMEIDWTNGAHSDSTWWQIKGYLPETPTNTYASQNRAQYKYLYFYVGKYEESAIAQAAGINSELLNNKVDKSDMVEVQCVVETYVNGNSWYRIYSDGWCEQGGIIASNTTSVSLLKSYVNTNYGVLMAGFDYAANDQPIGTSAKTVSGFTVNTSTYRRYWEAKGYIL